MNRLRATALTLTALLVLAALPARAEEAPAPAAPKADAAKPEKESDEGGKVERRSLADKIAPVSGNLFTKDRRFEITPAIGFSLDDAFFQKYAFGLKLGFHVLESFSIGLHASYALATPGSAVSVCRTEEGCRSPEMGELKNVPGKVQLLAGLDLAWSPIYGKINVIAEKVLHFDTAIIVGGSAVQYQAPGGTNKFTFGGHVGLAERFFITPSVTLRLELRDYIYGAQTPRLTRDPNDPSSKTETRVQNQLMFELGVSFFVGGGPRD